jgi:hypothetical protein
VLDYPNIPERKSFPPRTLILFLGMTLSFAAATTWVFGKTTWDHADSSDPRKQFAQEVFTTVKATIPHFSQNGKEKVADPEKSRRWFSRRGQDAAQK